MEGSCLSAPKKNDTTYSLVVLGKALCNVLSKTLVGLGLSEGQKPHGSRQGTPFSSQVGVKRWKRTSMPFIYTHVHIYIYRRRDRVLKLCGSCYVYRCNQTFLRPLSKASHFFIDARARIQRPLCSSSNSSRANG